MDDDAKIEVIILALIGLIMVTLAFTSVIDMDDTQTNQTTIVVEVTP